MNDRQKLEAIVSVVCKYLPPDGIDIKQAMNEIIGLVDPLPLVLTTQLEQEPTELNIWKSRALQAEAVIEKFMAQPAPLQGWRWVPVKPNKEMVNALADTDPEHESVWDAVLSAVPPQRTWVGLTNNEVNNFAAGCHLGKSVQGAIYEAEAKLKEKNT